MATEQEAQATSEGEIVAPAWQAAEESVAAEEARAALIQEAKSYLSDEEIASLKDDGAIRLAAEAAKRAAEKARSQFVVTPAAPAADAAPTGAQGLDEIVIPPEQDQVDPAAWKAVEALKKQIAGLTKEPAVPAASQMDWLFAGASKDVPEIGEGPTALLPRNHVAAQVRQKVVQEVERIQSEARQAGKPVPSLQEAFDAGLRSVCGGSVAAAENRRKVAQAAAREAAIQQRAGGVQRVLPHGKERAILALEQHRRKAGAV